jgi:hypothetical protein
MNQLAGPLPDPDLLRRLRLLARVVRALIVVGALALVGVELWSWSTPEHALAFLKHTEVAAPSVSARTQAMGALFSLLPLVVQLVALQRLWGVFGEYAQGRVFSRRALVCLRGFARWLLVDTAAAPVFGAFLSVIATWENGPGHRELNVQFGTDDYTQLLFGLVILAISTVMVEAARVAEDNEGFV